MERYLRDKYGQKLTPLSRESSFLEVLEQLPGKRRRFGRISWKNYYDGRCYWTRVFVRVGIFRRVEITREMPQICKDVLFDYISKFYETYERKRLAGLVNVENVMKNDMERAAYIDNADRE